MGLYRGKDTVGGGSTVASASEIDAAILAASTSATNAASSATASQAAQAASETAETNAETAETNSETAQGLSETAQAASETAQGLSETAQAASETAQGLSETAQTASETAQTAAELAETHAETAETNAETAQTAAEVAQAAAEAAAADADEARGFLDAVSETFPGITTAVAVSNIYEPFLESDWPLMMEDKSWFDEDGVGGDGVWHGSITTTERDTLSPSEGDVCYNTTTSTFQKYLSSSWGTTYRGPQREFPARAVAVAEADKVIIYDLTQSEPVMWMVFNGDSGTALGDKYSLFCLIGTGNITGLSFRGGKLYRAGTGGWS